MTATDDHTTAEWDPDEPTPLHAYEQEASTGGYDDLYDLPAPSTYKINGNGRRPAGDDGGEHTSWWPVDLAGLFDGSTEPPEPTMFTRTDGQPVLYPGKVHSFNGESESGKSWAALVPCVEEINAGHHVWYFDFEDDATTLVSRLLALGAKPEAVIRYLHYASPSEPLAFKGRFTPAHTEFVVGLDRWAPTLTVIDGITEAMTLHGLDLNSNQDYATFHNLLPRRLSRMGSAVVTVDHVTKNLEGRGRFAIGAQHKLAGMDGAVFGFEVVRPFGLGLHGVARLVIQKDRPGQLRRHARGKGVIGEFHLESDPDTHAVKAWFGPAPTEAEIEETREWKVMEKVSHWLAVHPGEHSRSTITAGVKARKQDVLEAIDGLVPMYATSRQVGNGYRVGHLKLYRRYDDDDE